MTDLHSDRAASAPVPESIFVTAPDGLRLHVRSYGRRSAPRLPVMCLPGLTRTGADFDTLANALAHDPENPRWVVALDARGRGRSDYDRSGEYSFATELADVIAVATALEAAPAVFIGSSRGGLLTMMLAVARPMLIAGAILNDIGPVIEPKGLMRLRGYVGRMPQPRSFEEGAEILRRLFDSQFPKLTPQDWLASARRGWEERRGRLVPTYDIRLARTLSGVDLERPLPPLWKEFDALAGIPLMVVRGANSDLLSPRTVEAMRARRADMNADLKADLDFIEVPDQGHTPLLAEPDTIGAIARFAAGCEKARPGRRAGAAA
jgi:pimeloyl-ACP methyl ester carboxylesterase